MNNLVNTPVKLSEVEEAMPLTGQMLRKCGRRRLETLIANLEEGTWLNPRSWTGVKSSVEEPGSR